MDWIAEQLKDELLDDARVFVFQGRRIPLLLSSRPDCLPRIAFPGQPEAVDLTEREFHSATAEELSAGLTASQDLELADADDDAEEKSDGFNFGF